MRSCIVDNVKNKVINSVREHLLNGAPSYKLIGEEIFIPVTANRTKQDAYNLAVNKIKEINSLFKAHSFGPVVFLNENYDEGVGIRINPSQTLLDAYEVKNGNKDIQEISPKQESSRLEDSVISNSTVSTNPILKETSLEVIEEVITEEINSEISFEEFDRILDQQEDSFDYNKICLI